MIILCVCITALILLVQRLNSDNLAALCLDSVAKKVLKLAAMHHSFGGEMLSYTYAIISYNSVILRNDH